MTTKKISELSPAAAITGTEQVPVVQSGATVRSTVAAIIASALNRANHTGTQVIATVTGLQAALDAKAADSAVIKTTGAQTKAGVLTLSSAPLVPDGSWTIAKTVGLADALNSLQPFYNVTEYGAVSGGTAAANKTAFTACQAAMASSTYGGTFYVPAGLYDVGDFAFTLPQSSGKAYHLLGDGPYSTFIYRSVDGAAGDKFIKASAVGGTVFSTVRNMNIRGPGTGVTLVRGVSPCTMDGIRAQGGMILENLVLTGWHAGVVDTGDHITYRHVDSKFNFYGAYYAEGVTRDDILWDNCDLTSNTMASVGIAAGASNFMSGVTFLRGHFGYGPHGIYHETEAGYPTKLNNITFLGTSWEALGIAAIYSASKTMAANNITLEGNGIFSLNNAAYGIAAQTTAADGSTTNGTTVLTSPTMAATIYSVGATITGTGVGAGAKITSINSATSVNVSVASTATATGTIAFTISHPADYMFYLGRIAGWHIRSSTMSGFGSVPLVAYLATDFIDTALTWEDWLGDFQSSRTAGVAFILCPGPGGGVHLRSGGSSGTETGIESARAYYGGVGLVQRGDLIEAFGGIVQRKTADRRAIGVALNTPTVTYEMCVVAERADRVTVNVTSASVAATDVLVADAATPYKLTNIALSAATAANPVVGQVDAAVGSVSGGQIVARVRT